MKIEIEYKTPDIIAAILIITGGAIVLYCRIDGIDLTEGQLLAQYWPGFLLAVICFTMSFILQNSPYFDRRVPNNPNPPSMPLNEGSSLQKKKDPSSKIKPIASPPIPTLSDELICTNCGHGRDVMSLSELSRIHKIGGPL